MTSRMLEPVQRSKLVAQQVLLCFTCMFAYFLCRHIACIHAVMGCSDKGQAGRMQFLAFMRA